MNKERDFSLDDYSGLNEYKKKKREKWESIFINQYLGKLKKKYQITFKNNGYEIMTDNGIMKFFPKSQSLYFANKKVWLKKYGLKWIKENLI